jgi:hypothetical protein
LACLPHAGGAGARWRESCASRERPFFAQRIARVAGSTARVRRGDGVSVASMFMLTIIQPWSDRFLQAICGTACGARAYLRANVAHDRGLLGIFGGEYSAGRRKRCASWRGSIGRAIDRYAHGFRIPAFSTHGP